MGEPEPADPAPRYTGHVDSGQSAVLELPGVTVVKTSVGPMDNNSYLLVCGRTGAALLIDAAADPDTLLAAVARYAPRLGQIVTTHAHRDHWQALEAVAGATGVPTAAHRLDTEPLPVAPDRLLADGDTVTVGDLELAVIHLQGHTEGSVALALTVPPVQASGDAAAAPTTVLFTGDCLFPGGIGKTGGERDFTRLLDGVTEKVFGRYGDTARVLPGHGDDTTLGAERPALPQWRERGW